MSHIRVPIASVVCALIALVGAARPALSQPTSNAFTYQGELRSSGVPFVGSADVRFTLWTAESGGGQIGAALQALGVDVSAGRFAVILNSGNEFGPGAFNGQRRWIEMSVRTSEGGGAYEVLSPRQEVTVAPHAAFATDAGTVGGLTPDQLRDAGSLTGTLPDARLSGNIPLRGASQTFSGANTFTGPNAFNNAGNTYAGNGAGLTALNASFLGTGTVPDARLSASVALRNVNQTFTGANVFTGANTFAALTSFNDRIGVGTVPSGNFRMHLAGGAGQWKGGIASSGATYAVVMGELAGRATIGSNDAAFQSWTDLEINPFGGNVIIGGGSQAQPGGTLQVAFGPDVTNSPYTGYLRVGSTGGQSLAMDGDEISSQTVNGTASTLRLNRLGGNVVVGGALTVPSVEFGNGSVMTSAPIVREVFDATLRTVPAGGWIEYNLNVPGARPGMGIIVNPVGPLQSFDVLASARYSGFDNIQIRIQNTGNSGTAYVNRTWIVTLIPAQ